MYILENFSVALGQIKANKLRSILTTLGITIGIATVILIVSILEGYNQNITAELNMLGANVFQVQKYEPNVGFKVGFRHRKYRKDLIKEYAKEIRERCDAVKFVGAEVWNMTVSFHYKDKKTNPRYWLAGGEPEFFENNAEPIGRGRGLIRNDIASNARVVVLGMDIVEELFPFEDPLGKTIKIAGIKFKVIGTMEKLGTSTFGQSKDNKGVIPITTFEDIYGKYRSVNLTVQSNHINQLEEAQSQVIGLLRQLRKIPPGEDNNFAIWNNDSLVESFRKTADMIQLGAVLIGLISLLVGSIGVMNIMLVSVTERTSEIGVRKAVGAKRTAILFQFLNESIFLSFIGGSLGLFIGFSMALILSTAFNIPFTLPIWAVAAALVVTTVVGITAGMYPAAKASKLDPIVALRFE
jgi:putative ABC transport system permease protein